MPRKVTLNVHPNPFCADVDHEGRLCGRVQYEPNPKGDAGLMLIGALLTSTMLHEGDGPEGKTSVTGRPRDDDHVWTYETEPVLVDCTAYYLQQIQKRTLFPADARTHAIAFGSEKGFIDPYVRIAQLAAERKVWPSPEDKWREACGVKPAGAPGEESK